MFEHFVVTFECENECSPDLSQIRSGDSCHFTEKVPDGGVCRVRQCMAIVVNEEVVGGLQTFAKKLFNISVSLEPLLDSWNN